MSKQRIVRVTARTLYRQLEKEGVLLQLDTGEYFGLEGVSHRMWQLLADKGDVAQVTDVLLAEYDVPADELAADLDEFIQKLIDCQLVELEFHNG